ncbi:MAG: DinB family protein [Bacteroidota bacterium]
MTKYLELLERKRATLLKKTRHLTTGQYNLVPPASNNNIIWNMGHTLVVTESLLYSKTPSETPVHEFDIERFKKGTKPEEPINDHGVSLIRQALLDTVPLFIKLLNDKESESLHTSQSDPLHTLVGDRSLRFVLFHEDMHFAKIQQLLLDV